MTFCTSVGLPITLGQLGLTNVSDVELIKVAELAVVEGETIHNMPFPVSAEMVFYNMKAADALGKDFLAR